MTDTYGLTSPQQFAFFDHDSSSWRMWPDIGLWGSIPFLQTWPKHGMTRSGAAFELQMSAHPTAGSGCSSLLPTPGTMDDREKRTTHAGGNLTLQGAIVGVNPVDAERHSAAGRTVHR
jgi:hypothetical protein